MAVLKQEDGKKWVQALVAIGGIIGAYVLSSFLHQIGEWFDIEAKVHYFNGGIQVFSIIVGIILVVMILRNKSAVQYLDEVYAELVKVVWPDRESTLKLTIGIIIGIIITSIVLGFVDFGIGKIFRLLYS